MSDFEPLTGYNIYNDGHTDLEVYNGDVEITHMIPDEGIISSVYISEETFLKLVEKYLADRECLDDFGL